MSEILISPERQRTIKRAVKLSVVEEIFACGCVGGGEWKRISYSKNALESAQCNDTMEAKQECLKQGLKKSGMYAMDKRYSRDSFLIPVINICNFSTFFLFNFFSPAIFFIKFSLSFSLSPHTSSTAFQ